MPSRDSTHYTVLGVSETATSDDIRRAFRKLVLRYHPDRSGDKSTTDRFVAITEAYEVLSDFKRRTDYDTVLQYRKARHQSPPPKQQPRPTTPQKATAPPVDVSARIAEAIKFYSKGKHEDAEATAKRVLRLDPRQAMAHAILGDIARSRQQFEEAITRYGYAIQFEPDNVTFLRRYEEVLRQTTKPTGRGGHISAKQPSSAPIAIALALSFLLMLYVALANEEPLAPQIAFIDTWTLGLVLMLFINGIAAGIALSLSQLIDNWSSVATSSGGRASPIILYGAFALFNFWLSATLYVAMGLFKNSFAYNISRAITAVAILTCCYALMATINENLLSSQTLLWGGNVLFVGFLAGWAIADAFR